MCITSVSIRSNILWLNIRPWVQCTKPQTTQSHFNLLLGKTNLCILQQWFVIQVPLLRISTTRRQTMYFPWDRSKIFQSFITIQKGSIVQWVMHVFIQLLITLLWYHCKFHLSIKTLSLLHSYKVLNPCSVLYSETCVTLLFSRLINQL